MLTYCIAIANLRILGHICFIVWQTKLTRITEHPGIPTDTMASLESKYNNVTWVMTPTY